MTVLDGIESTQDGAVVTITIDRQDRLNSLTTASLTALADALQAADQPKVEVIVLRGAGRAFCTGADLGFVVDAQTVDAAKRVVIAMAEIEPTIIVALHGPVAGVGVSIALAGDLVIAAESAFLLLPFLGIGLVPDGGATHSVLIRAGRTRAARMAYGGERIPANLAAEWGLIGEVVPDDDLLARTEHMTGRILDAPRAAAVATKRLLRRAEAEVQGLALDAEALVQAELLASDDYRVAREGFLTKRPVTFRT